MNCQIVNKGTNINLITENGEEMIRKNKISGIIIVGHDKLRIDTNANAKSYLIEHKNVVNPISKSVVDLARLLQRWCGDKNS